MVRELQLFTWRERVIVCKSPVCPSLSRWSFHIRPALEFMVARPECCTATPKCLKDIVAPDLLFTKLCTQSPGSCFQYWLPRGSKVTHRAVLAVVVFKLWSRSTHAYAVYAGGGRLFLFSWASFSRSLRTSAISSRSPCSNVSLPLSNETEMEQDKSYPGHLLCNLEFCSCCGPSGTFLHRSGCLKPCHKVTWHSRPIHIRRLTLSGVVAAWVIEVAIMW